jgi:hypothetical protein
MMRELNVLLGDRGCSCWFVQTIHPGGVGGLPKSRNDRSVEYGPAVATR